MIRLLAIFLILFLSVRGFSQEKFSLEELKNPRKYGEKIEKLFSVSELYEFISEEKENIVYLKNGLRSANYINPENWLSICDEVEVQSVSLVFSKYPVGRNGYSMSHPLLFARLSNLFKIDPYLNDVDISWNIVLHTHCENDVQVDNLFHGVVIKYLSFDAISNDSDTLIEIQSEATVIIKQKEKALDSVLSDLNSFYELPDSINALISSMEEDEKKEFMIDYFEEKIASKDTIIITKKYLRKQEIKIDGFLKKHTYSSDSTVFKVMDRHAEWNDILVVADWTGSMYMYGAQILMWHILNFEYSNIRYFTLFNDGDAKHKKQIGSTGGVYFEEAGHIDEVFDLYQLVMFKGGGGDCPENDIEGILKAMEEFPDHESIVLIADNNSLVRDIELLNRVDKPVKVIMCGYNERYGLHPDYVRIAYETGGSIHTIEEDIENILIETNKKGEIIGIVDSEVKIKSGRGVMTYKYTIPYNTEKEFTDLDSAKVFKKYVKKLALTSKSYDKIPREIHKFKNLHSLDLSDNNIEKITYLICNKESLRELKMANNKIIKIPKRIRRLSFLKSIDLSNNLIDTIALEFMSLRHLEYCDLSGNQIRYLPRMNFRKLKYLYLDDNLLTEVPGFIGRMKKLVELSLSGNDLDEITKRVGYLKRLEVLDLSDNNLTTLPKTFARLKKLSMLRISGNPISQEEFQKIREMLPNTTIEF